MRDNVSCRLEGRTRTEAGGPLVVVVVEKELGAERKDSRMNELQDLNDVLVEFNIFLTNAVARRRLLGRLLDAGITEHQLRRACLHQKSLGEKGLGGRIVEMIQTDPPLAATLHAADRKDLAEPGRAELQDNQAWRHAHPAAQEDRLAMNAYNMLRHEGYTPARARAVLGESPGNPMGRQRFASLVLRGAELCGAPPRTATYWLLTGNVKALTCWLVLQRHGSLKRESSRTHLQAALATLPPEAQAELETG